MKIFKFGMFIAAISSLAVFTTSCDWTGGGGSSDFNTSQGAGVNVNWSGVYFGQMGGGKAVGSTSGGPIVRLVLSQGGNRVEVVDNNGSRYEGSVGAPGVVSTGDAGVLSSGSTLVEAQIQWTGKDEVAAKDIEFVGIIHVVAVSDIQGETTTDTRTGTSTDSSSTSSGVSQPQQTVNTSGGGTTIEPGSSSGETNAVSNTRTVTTTATTTYQITEANSQFRLQGTWIEIGGQSSAVDALSPGGIATITTSSDSATTTN